MNSKGDVLDFEWLGLVKQCPCSVCNASAPSYAHHIKQQEHFIAVALCYDCHQGVNGIHGDRNRWRIFKATEEKALNTTIKNIYRLFRPTLKATNFV